MLPISTALPMYLLTHLFIWKWTRWIFFIQWIKIFYFLLLILLLILSRVWPMETSSWLLCPFDMSPLLFEHLLNFWYKRCFRLILGFPCLGTGISLFLRISQGIIFIPEVSLPFGSSSHQQLGIPRVPCLCLWLLVFSLANCSFQHCAHNRTQTSPLQWP